jgi:hypothetical protein
MKILDKIRDLIQVDPGNRGLASDPSDNLLTRTRSDFADACRCLARERLQVMIVTGFWIPAARALETDGPMGAMLLARALFQLGHTVSVRIDAPGLPALRAAQARIPEPVDIGDSMTLKEPIDVLIAIERAGPSHTIQSLVSQPEFLPEDLPAFEQACPSEARDRYHTMRGIDITAFMQPAHKLFEQRVLGRTVTIGIGDGGNELGMGKIPWRVLARNVRDGGRVACRTVTDHTIICGVSNWGGYALAAGICALRGVLLPKYFAPEAEQTLWQAVLAEANLVDGVTAKRELSVDGLAWPTYSHPLESIRKLLEKPTP